MIEAKKKGRRGPGRFYFTYDDLASLVGLKRETVMKDAHGKGRRFDPHSIASVLAYVVGRLDERAATTGEA